jgi:hypothetical protein
VNDLEQNNSKSHYGEPEVLVFDFNHCRRHVVLVTVAAHSFVDSRLHLYPLSLKRRRRMHHRVVMEWLIAGILGCHCFRCSVEQRVNV